MVHIVDASPTHYIIDKNESLTIDGYSQPGTSRNTASIGQPFNAKLGIQLNLYTITINNANDLHITGLNIQGHDNAIRYDSVDTTPPINDIWLEGNYFGTNIDGSNLAVAGYSSSGGIRFTQEMYGFVIGTNGDGVNDAGEFNIISGQNQPISGLITIYSFDPITDVRISGNYIHTDYTGEVCSD
ncbi:MAG: hypothetical protein Q9M76_06705 [Candidatus Dojkabacteria bacterium]|nr:hypothetical protein [Candidatus Dojkabacteria bacterium]